MPLVYPPAQLHFDQIYELYSNYLLFDISDGPTYSKTDLHLALMESIRGKFPKDYFQQANILVSLFFRRG